MSARQYYVTVKLKDDGTLKAIQNLGSGGGSSGAGGSRGGGGRSSGKGGFFSGLGIPGGSGFDSLQKVGAAQLLKLTGIGFGIASLVALTVKSSGALQGTLKILETTAMLILKPIGDFFGMLFRPFTILMLQYAIQFYKVAGKWFIEAGRQAGGPTAEVLLGLAHPDVQKALVDFGTSVSASINGVNDAINKTFLNLADMLGKSLSNVPNFITAVFGNFASDLFTRLQNIPNNITAIFGNFGSDLFQRLMNIPNVLTAIFGNFGSTLFNGLTSIPGMIADIFTGLATNLASKLAGIPQAIWDAIVRAISGATGGRGNTISPQATNNNNGTRLQMANMASSVSIS